MNYAAFYQEIVAWIANVNKLATQHGMESSEFWIPIVKSIGEICEKYNNNPLVVKQMAMLYEWLDEIYMQMKG